MRCHPGTGRLGGLLGLPKVLFQPLAFGDVLDDRDEVGGLARRIALERGGQLNPDERAILADVPLLQRVVGQLSP